MHRMGGAWYAKEEICHCRQKNYIHKNPPLTLFCEALGLTLLGNFYISSQKRTPHIRCNASNLGEL